MTVRASGTLTTHNCLLISHCPLSAAQHLETLPPATRDGFLAALGAAQTAARSAVVSKRAKISDSHWSIWTSFLYSLHIGDPYLVDFPDPIPLPQVFAEHLRSGQLAPSGDPI
jgi:hypothetical protein